MDAQLTALAVGAHPDDIEFTMAGTLLQLKEHGVSIHMWNLSRGGCGSTVYEKSDLIKLRWQEASASARLAGATLHKPLADDFSVFYEPSLLARVSVVVREIQPHIILTHSPDDYMEDHENTCRLVVSAAFTRGMPNYRTKPESKATGQPVAVYHGLPHGLRDNLRRRIVSSHYVDISPVLSLKRKLLACHQTQKDWLDQSQNMDSYLNDMTTAAAEVGTLSGRFQYAEAWRLHLHLGFRPASFDPLKELLGPLCLEDPRFEDVIT